MTISKHTFIDAYGIELTDDLNGQYAQRVPRNEYDQPGAAPQPVSTSTPNVTRRRYRYDEPQHHQTLRGPHFRVPPSEPVVKETAAPQETDWSDMSVIDVGAGWTALPETTEASVELGERVEQSEPTPATQHPVAQPPAVQPPALQATPVADTAAAPNGCDETTCHTTKVAEAVQQPTTVAVTKEKPTTVALTAQQSTMVALTNVAETAVRVAALVDQPMESPILDEQVPVALVAEAPVAEVSSEAADTEPVETTATETKAAEVAETETAETDVAETVQRDELDIAPEAKEASPIDEPVRNDEQVMATSPLPEASPIAPAWEVDRFAWPADVEALFEEQTDYFQHTGQKLLEASREGLSKLAVTSAQAGEGTTTVTLCLARAVAAAGGRVAVLDGNLRNSHIGKALSLEFASGWQVAASGAVELAEAAIAGLDESITLFPAATSAGSVTGLADSSVRDVLRRAAAGFDLLLIDAGQDDFGENVAEIDAAMVVRDVRQTSEQQSLATALMLRDAGVKAVGIAENFSQPQEAAAAA